MLSSCITVNVNFPEAAVRQAADEYVNELYRLKKESETQEKPSSQLRSPQFLNIAMSLMIPVASAQDAKLLVSSPKIKEIQLREVSRLGKLDDWKSQGFIGETASGTLELKGEPKALLKSEIQKLIKAENEDREQLYAEVLRLNNLNPSDIERVRAYFSVSFQEKSKKGTWIQSPSDKKWTRK